MSHTCRLGSWILLLFLLTASESGPATAQSKGERTIPAPQAARQKAQNPASALADDADTADAGEADEELAPAAVQLDLAGASPLIESLYRATRETKESDALTRLTEAEALVPSANVKAVDAQGRTALHWAVFGSSYTTRPKLVVAYEEIADKLIERGVEINREDAYNDTAFDYLLYSPNFEMQTLLLEHGATSGFLAASANYTDQLAAVQSLSVSSGVRSPANAAGRAAKKAAPVSAAAADPTAPALLKPGLTLSVRLDVPVYSDRSRTGDPIEGTVTYPLCTNGEQLVCSDGQLLVPPGTRVNGTVLFAQKAPDKYSRPLLVLDFSNVLHETGGSSALYARVLDVDNARETVRNNEILGIIQPHAPGKTALALSVVSAVNPVAGYAMKGVQTVYGLSIRREILLPAGTDLQIQIVRPSRLKVRQSWPGWKLMPADPRLASLVEAAPLRTQTPAKASSDITNLMFLGSQEQIIAAFNEAGWFEADDLTFKSGLKTVQATFRKTGYDSAPVSMLLLNERPPDLVFQKSLDTFAKRHHLRVWKQPGLYNGQEVWVAAATHDIAVSNARKGTKWSHRIDPHIDRERDWVQTDLLFTGTAVAYRDVDRPHAPRKAANATGDDIVTDGKMTVLQLAPAKAPVNSTADATAPGATPALLNRR